MRAAPQVIRVGEAADGTLTYLVAQPPSALPPVHGRDLAAAWDSAREAAIGAVWGTARLFRFQLGDGTTADLVLQDRDARCWAGAVERLAGLHTLYGLSLCLRLLALVDLLGRARWTDALRTLNGGGTELSPVLLRAVASAELTNEARFDERRLRAGLALLSAPSAGAYA